MVSPNDFPIHRLDSGSGLLPAELWAIDRPPKELFIRGKPEALALLGRLPEDGLAIVGTRVPQHRSLALTERAVRLLAGSRLIVISGLALGIDSRAHQTALAAGIPTVAILGCGITHVYPAENLALAGRILESGGLLVSEFEPGAAPVAFQFLLRNRLIATWSKATWVVEASVRSGALNTARWARDHARTCLATPGFPGNPALLGNQDLIDQHHAQPFWNAHSLGTVWLELAALGLKSKTQRIFSSSMPTSNPRSTRLLREIRRQTAARGGIQVETLLEWSIALGWTPMDFYESLQIALRSAAISDQGGFLVTL